MANTESHVYFFGKNLNDRPTGKKIAGNVQIMIHEKDEKSYRIN